MEVRLAHGLDANEVCLELIPSDLAVYPEAYCVHYPSFSTVRDMAPIQMLELGVIVVGIVVALVGLRHKFPEKI